jgi:hypothetical protein
LWTAPNGFLKLLLERNSASSVERITGIRHGTILKLLVHAGEKREHTTAQRVRNVQVRDIKMDEAWSFIGSGLPEGEESAPVRSRFSLGLREPWLRPGRPAGAEDHEPAPGRLALSHRTGRQPFNQQAPFN